jgi:xanthine dehydrogenase YagS FAD-binding subunit
VATIAGGVWQDGRIVLGGVAPVPWRAEVVEQALVGKDVKSAARAAAALVRNQARPLSNNAYKVDIAVGLTERAVLSLLA